MRSLIVRFADYEGPGIIEKILQDQGYGITFHDAYRKGLRLLENSHLVFDLLVLMGGPQSVYDPDLQSFFQPYIKLVKEMLRLPNKKIIGVCLGSQVLAEALGSKVIPGGNGQEIGFGKCQIKISNHPVFQNLNTQEINVFHWHGDTFFIPNGAEHLLSSEKYPSQMFAYQNKAFGIQCHLEITKEILSVWKSKSNDLKNALQLDSEKEQLLLQEVQKVGSIVIENIINL